MANVPYTDGTFKTPDSVDVGRVTSPEMPSIGSGISGGLSNIADSLTKIKAENDHTAGQEFLNDLQAKGAQTKYGDPSAPNSQGFLTLQGKEAINNWQNTIDSFDQYRKTGLAALTSEQRKMVEQQSLSYQNNLFGDMASHVARQREVYQRQTNAAGIDNAGNSAAENYQKPDALQAYIRHGVSIVDRQSQIEGLTPDDPIAVQRRQEAFGTMGAKVINAYLAANDPLGAQAFVDANKGNFPADIADNITKSLHGAVVDKRGELNANRIMGMTNGVISPIPQGVSLPQIFPVQEHTESRGQQFGKDGSVLRSMPGDPDSPRGLMQIRPSTAQDAAKYAGIQFDPKRLDSDAAYNRGLGHAKMYQLCQKYGNNLNLACAAYNWGEGNVDKALKVYGDPRTGAISDADFISHTPPETQKYIGKLSSGVSPQMPALSYSAPDFTKWKQDAVSGDDDTESKMATLHHLNEYQTLWESGTKAQQDALTRKTENLYDQFMGGNISAPVPVDEIRQFQEPSRAAETIKRLQVAQQAGGQYASLKWASPSQKQQALAAGQDQLDGEDVDHYRIRSEAQRALAARLTQDGKALHDDPVSFVASSPALAQVTQALQNAQASGDESQIAQAQQLYIQASMSEQKRLNPLGGPRALTNDQVQQAVQTLTNVDPAKQDIVPVLNGLEKQYGPHLWPQAFGEMVRVGKIPEEYQILANMDASGQVAGRQMYAANLKMSVDDLIKAAGLEGKGLSPSSANGDPIADIMAPFAETTRLQGGGIGLNNLTRNAIERQTLGYMARGQNQSSALQNAYADIIGAKYDTSGTIRAPKGELPAVQSATRYALSRLTPADIQTLPELDYIPENQRASYTIDRARHLGEWVMNGDESGYNLAMPTRSPGQYRTLMNKDGTPFTVTLKGIRSGQYASPYDSNALKLAQQAQAAYVQQYPGAK